MKYFKRKNMFFYISRGGVSQALTIRLGVWGSVVSSSSGVRAEPRPKWFLCVFDIRKKPSGIPFAVFLSDGVAPKTSWGPRKVSPLSPPLNGPGR